MKWNFNDAMALQYLFASVYHEKLEVILWQQKIFQRSTATSKLQWSYPTNFSDCRKNNLIENN